VDTVVSAIKSVFDSSKKFDMSQEEFDEMKKSHYGSTLRAYETVGGLCSYFVYDLFTSSNDFFKEIEEVKQLTLEDINKAYYNICNAVTTLVVLRGE
jgi:predicted Zn-dependent peptidase